MSLPHTTGAYSLGPDDGEILWFNGALGLLRATADQTEGRFAAFELRPPKGFASPLHSHKSEDEFFLSSPAKFASNTATMWLKAWQARSFIRRVASATLSTSIPTTHAASLLRSCWGGRFLP